MAERGIAINGAEPTMKNESMKASWIAPVSCLFWAVLVGVTMNAGNAAEPASDPESKSAEELAKETQNPVANLISVPFQNNFNFGIGPNDATQDHYAHN
jgi:Na+/proline symporter